MFGKNQRRKEILIKIEIVHEVSQYRCAFTHCWSWIWATIGLRIQPGPSQEIIFYELQISVKTKSLMINIMRLSIRRNDHCWYPKAITISIHDRWNYMIVEATPVIPC